MTLDELIKSKRIRKQDVSIEDVIISIDKAKADLVTASQIIQNSNSWAFAIAYNAILQAARAYLFANGYRPASHESHKNVFLFLHAVMPEEHHSLVSYLDRMRRKRNESVYDVSDLITRTDAETLLKRAE
jgi:uncharacterized protein (UPF0332 family)